MQKTQLDRSLYCYEDQFSFKAMGCPCQILMRLYGQYSKQQAFDLMKTAMAIGLAEVNRLEDKYSRYKKESYLSFINQHKPVDIDHETYALFEIADVCFQVSDGLFDITSGVLRKHWQFYGDEIKKPQERVLQATCQSIGWQKIQWQSPQVKLLQGMEIDLGGIVKEYAVDRVCTVLNSWIETYDQHIAFSFLVNLGGDIRCVSREQSQPLKPWVVTVEGQHSKIKLCNKAIATSGIGHRYLMLNGKKYGHILNPMTGMPIENQPHSVSVISDNAVHAGMLASVAMTKGLAAEKFLKETGCKYILVVK